MWESEKAEPKQGPVHLTDLTAAVGRTQVGLEQVCDLLALSDAPNGCGPVVTSQTSEVLCPWQGLGGREGSPGPYSKVVPSPLFVHQTLRVRPSAHMSQAENA